MLIGPITVGIDIYQLIKMVFARFLHVLNNLPAEATPLCSVIRIQ